MLSKDEMQKLFASERNLNKAGNFGINKSSSSFPEHMEYLRNKHRNWRQQYPVISNFYQMVPFFGAPSTYADYLDAAEKEDITGAAASAVETGLNLVGGGLAAKGLIRGGGAAITPVRSLLGAGGAQGVATVAPDAIRGSGGIISGIRNYFLPPAKTYEHFNEAPDTRYVNPAGKLVPKEDYFGVKPPPKATDASPASNSSISGQVKSSHLNAVGTYFGKTGAVRRLIKAGAIVKIAQRGAGTVPPLPKPATVDNRNVDELKLAFNEYWKKFPTISGNLPPGVTDPSELSVDDYAELYGKAVRSFMDTNPRAKEYPDFENYVVGLSKGLGRSHVAKQRDKNIADYSAMKNWAKQKAHDFGTSYVNGLNELKEKENTRLRSIYGPMYPSGPQYPDNGQAYGRARYIHGNNATPPQQNMGRMGVYGVARGKGIGHWAKLDENGELTDAAIRNLDKRTRDAVLAERAARGDDRRVMNEPTPRRSSMGYMGAMSYEPEDSWRERMAAQGMKPNEIQKEVDKFNNRRNVIQGRIAEHRDRNKDVEQPPVYNRSGYGGGIPGFGTGTPSPKPKFEDIEQTELNKWRNSPEGREHLRRQERADLGSRINTGRRVPGQQPRAWETGYTPDPGQAGRLKVLENERTNKSEEVGRKIVDRARPENKEKTQSIVNSLNQVDRARKENPLGTYSSGPAASTATNPKLEQTNNTTSQTPDTQRQIAEAAKRNREIGKNNGGAGARPPTPTTSNPTPGSQPVGSPTPSKMPGAGPVNPPTPPGDKPEPRKPQQPVK